MATCSSNISWKIPWVEEPGELQFRGWQRIGHGWAQHTSHTYVHVADSSCCAVETNTLLYSNKNFRSIKIHCLYSQIDRFMIQDWPNLGQSPLLYVHCHLPYRHTHTHITSYHIGTHTYYRGRERQQRVSPFFFVSGVDNWNCLWPYLASCASYGYGEREMTNHLFIWPLNLHLESLALGLTSQSCEATHYLRRQVSVEFCHLDWESWVA